MARRFRLFAVALLLATSAQAQQHPDRPPVRYEEALREYQAGNLGTALGLLATVGPTRLDEAARWLWDRAEAHPATRLKRIRVAIALLTEMSFSRPNAGQILVLDPYRASARALVRRLVRDAEEGRDGAGAAERRFARDWYLLMVSDHHSRAEVGWSRAYLEEARNLFPDDPLVLLASGSDHEMVAFATAGFLRRFETSGQPLRDLPVNPDRELELAEKYLRQAAKLAPELVEARLRLGHVLYTRDDLDGAAGELQAALAQTVNENIRYLGLTFLGQVDAARGDFAAARRSYVEAVRLFPHNQAASLALSELAYLEGRGAEAAAGVVALMQLEKISDPWWAYLLGGGWQLEARLALMRAEVMQ